MSAERPRIPRHRAAVIPLGGRSLWLEMPSWMRVAVGVAAGLALLALVVSA